jgi:hypothetical protein
MDSFKHLKTMNVTGISLASTSCYFVISISLCNCRVEQGQQAHAHSVAVSAVATQVLAKHTEAVEEDRKEVTRKITQLHNVEMDIDSEDAERESARFRLLKRQRILQLLKMMNCAEFPFETTTPYC